MKHFRKRMLANGLAMALVVSSLAAIPSAAANNVDFKDIKGHWAESQIKNFLDKGYIEGYGDNTFRPDNKITRAEFIKIVNMAFGYTEKGTENFKDVNQEDWFYDEVLKAMKQGYIDGYGDDTFKPNDLISREEACKIVGVILKAYGYGNTTFKDDAEIESWAKKYVKGLVDMGIIDGFKEDNTFRPDANTSRAETVKTIKGAIEYRPSTGGGGGSTVSRNIIIDSSDDFNNLSGSYDKITVKGNITGEIKNITAKELVVESGDTITITNSAIINMCVKDTDNSIEIKSSGTTKISNVVLESGATLSYENNVTRTTVSPYGKVDVKTSENVIIDANVEEVTLSVASSRVELTEGTIVDKLVVSEKGAGAIIYGAGKIADATINADCTISNDITIDDDNGAGIIKKEVVSNLEELKAALLAEDKTEINLAADIAGIDKSIEVNREVTINGGGHILSFTGLENAQNTVDDGLILYKNATVNNLTVNAGLNESTKWDGTYAIQVYGATATLNNVTATGGNGGILVNGSTVTLGGTIDVSNNGFGGIEISKGTDLTQNSILDIGASNITNISEAFGLPTIWVVNNEGELTGGKFVPNSNIKHDQTQYYMDADNASVTVANASNLSELEKVLKNESITTINITKDITGIDKSIEVNREVTINGGGHTLSFTGLESASGTVDDGLILYKNATVNNLTVNAGLNDSTKWDGTYAIQVYGTTATLNNVTATGGNGGILVNGSTVTLGGTIDVSNNGFGGIEVSTGTGLTENSTLNIGTANITNTSEAYTLPTVWVINGQGGLVGGLFTPNEAVENGQTQYYLDSTNAGQETVNVSNLKGLEKALLDSSITTINITKDIAGIDKSIEVNGEVTINGGGHTLSFTGLESASGTVDDGLILYKNTTVNNLTVNAGLNDSTKWDGTYAIQVYGTTATLNNVTATGGNGGILVNGSTVTLGGTIDVSNNGFGGIEVSTGTGLTENSTLNIGTANITNTSEAYALPTIWAIDGQGTLNNGNQELHHITVEAKDGNQIQYYLELKNAESSSDSE